jgi:hypothetical protein
MIYLHIFSGRKNSLHTISCFHQREKIKNDEAYFRYRILKISSETLYPTERILKTGLHPKFNLTSVQQITRCWRLKIPGKNLIS